MGDHSTVLDDEPTMAERGRIAGDLVHAMAATIDRLEDEHRQLVGEVRRLKRENERLLRDGRGEER